ncbi:MAG TPA: tripartite tricarboxylate transporter substrate binding protein BugD [Acidiferrobacterales bacterium]|nr:tripartite tricarboxylate transporter substrate binding protein BugD [Acidiferrobacterales bacterium]
MSRKISVLLGVVLAVGATTAQAEKYPSRVITLVVPFSAGGPTDTVARMIAQPMSKTLGQTVIVENIGGAGGTIAAARVARANPDGYTIFLHHIGQATSATLYKNLTYNVLTDFEPIGLVTPVPMTIIARKDFPAKDAKEFITYVKANKDKITYGNAGIGAASHLCGMLFMSAIDTQFTTVSYKGTGPAMNDLLGGVFDFMCDQTTNTTGQIQGGKVKAYAVTSKKRVPSLKDLPTLHESGLKNFEVAVWHGLYAPKGTPKPVVDKISAALRVALKDATVKQRFAELGTEPEPADRATPAAHKAHLKAEVEKWAPIIKKAGVYAD